MNSFKPGIHHPAPRQTVIYGQAVDAALAQAQLQVPADRVLLVTTNSLADHGGLADRAHAALGSRWVETIAGIRAHSPRHDVIRIASRAAACNAQAVVAIGGGSVCDAVKVALLCLANDVSAPEDLDRLRSGQRVSAPTLGYVMIPTTLSAGEYTPSAGVTDERGPRKEAFRHPELAPDVVILDPEMTLSTPPRLWFSTGIRAVDHAVEGWCSINGTPHSEALALYALQLLVPGLQQSAAETRDLDARLACQIGAWLSIQGFVCGCDFGGSHGIGHALGGTAGMPHGETSCVMLPHVLRYNAQTDGNRQVALAQALGHPDRALADIVAGLVAGLGMPGRLRDAGVARDLLPQVAAEAVHDPWVQTNPRPIHGVEGVLELLQTAW